MYYYPVERVSCIVAIVSILVSAALLVGAIVALHFVKPMGSRVGIVGLFTVLFAVSIVLFTYARRVEVYEAAAAGELLEGQEHLYHFYGNTTDLYTKGLERRLVLLWQETRVHENSVKGFHGGDEYVAILYEVSILGPISYEIFQYPQQELLKNMSSLPN
jgi:hypothetical protein